MKATDKSEEFKSGFQWAISAEDPESFDFEEFKKGYEAGIELAKIKKWYVVSVKDEKAWYCKHPTDEMNSWVNTKELDTI